MSFKKRLLLLLLNSSYIIHERGNKVINMEYVNYDTHIYTYKILEDYLELLKAIQDRLIQKLCDK